MNLQDRIELLCTLGEYLKNDTTEWQQIKQNAFAKNGWFTPLFTDYACTQIADNFLQKDLLEKWVAHYHIDDNISPKNIGIVMAGNIPLVGFQDFLSVFISGHYQTIKLSSKDDILLKHLVKIMYSHNVEIQNHISFAEILKGCDAYIATGSNNSGRYFEQYFSKYPHIIRKNRTSVAVLDGNETNEQLEKLSDDIHLYFGFGCRNVTKIFVPDQYDFVPLLKAFDKYKYFNDHHKYKNNFDYQLSILLLNNIFYMTNGTTLLVENKAPFSPVSQLHFEYYQPHAHPINYLQKDEEIQCIVAKDFVPFGSTQKPGLMTYADGVDTMQFLLSI
ncbi:MAG: acyl-CoA reductase [Bacteroidetes bacterium]|nr:acyl-CoA reductase [Bacteroidota bacterium]